MKLLLNIPSYLVDTIKETNGDKSVTKVVMGLLKEKYGQQQVGDENVDYQESDAASLCLVKTKD